MGVDVAERRRYGARTPSRPAVVLLLLRIALLLAVAGLDRAGLSRALFVLIPFTAYFAFGRTTSLALAAAGLGVLLGAFAVTTSPGSSADSGYGTAPRPRLRP